MKNISFYKVVYLNEEEEKSYVFIDSNDFETLNKSIAVSPAQMKKTFSDNFKMLISIRPVQSGNYSKIYDSSERARTILDQHFWDSFYNKEDLGLEGDEAEGIINEKINLYDSAIEQIKKAKKELLHHLDYLECEDLFGKDKSK